MLSCRVWPIVEDFLESFLEGLFGRSAYTGKAMETTEPSFLWKLHVFGPPAAFTYGGCLNAELSTSRGQQPCKKAP